MIRRALIMASMVGLTTSCGSSGDDKPITMSVIADQRADGAVSPLLLATAQGLVAFDASGQIEPALAERWLVTDDGKSIIFRIRDSLWNDGSRVTSQAVAQSLNKIIARGSRNRLRPLLTSVEQIIPMTGQVLEIRLRSPQPEFLQLLAQPELALFKTSPTNGTGPYRIHSARGNVTRLRPIDPQNSAGELREREDIRIRREPAAIAIARFAGREIALVEGGDFASLPLVRPAGISASQFQVEPAYGLFGLAAVGNSKAVARVNVRRALAMAIDRERLVNIFGVDKWQPQYAVLPNQLDSASAPSVLEWVRLTPDQRTARARDYLADEPALPVLRVALPPGPGARLLFTAIAADWRKIGVNAVMVRIGAAADLRLIDEVAPQRPALWYMLRLSCARGLPCNDDVESAIEKATSAPSSAERSRAIADADAAIAADQLYIPLALPLRWSLVSPQLTRWRPNAFAVHPLRHLRVGER